MSIVYSLISRGTTVFCEHTSESGNFQQVTRTILEKFDSTQEGKHSYKYDEFVFHLITEQGIVYICMANKDFQRRIAFAFLEDIKQQFEEKYSDILGTAVAYEMNKTFGKVLSEKMEFYNSNPEADHIRKVKGEIEEVKQVMSENIERILDRGDKIELLVDKSGDLSEQALKFKRSSKQLQRKLWWHNLKLQIIIVGSVSVVMLIIILGATKCFGHC
ncbi:vesicle-associated membrane protein 7A [Guillardia theta CCMP2712]|uniref:Vesicle-associated membrane protein 7A n=1 Tax=Guillardia theta (strain CCMP2712) TaxID=905079 RepID=L1ILB1_GUITC|nr:vesicle-associated membrane protein 7A [Guillardia theta CCMP2712]EKX36902.1 vesicle-associated membrane protein 7A [Guillardia theta CCMP2712]|eukprot:XP_005823882.1 vesicle-associated membrane protein 7A [Guillardia theta CCMP2712]